MFSNIKAIEIIAPASSLQVTASDSNETHLQYEKVRWPLTADLVITQSGHRLIIAVCDPAGSSQVNFQIRTPRQTNLSIELNNSPYLSVQGVTGAVKIKTNTIGRLSCANTGAVSVESTSIEKGFFENLRQELYCAVKTGRIAIAFHRLPSDRHVFLNAGDASVTLSAPAHALFRNAVNTPNMMSIDSYGAQPDAPAITLEGFVRPDRFTFEALRPALSSRL
jgi:hypothetical protein